MLDEDEQTQIYTYAQVFSESERVQATADALARHLAGEAVISSNRAGTPPAFTGSVDTDRQQVVAAIKSNSEKGENEEFSEFIDQTLQAYNDTNDIFYEDYIEFLTAACEYGRYITAEKILKFEGWEQKDIEKSLLLAIENDNPATVAAFINEQSIQHLLTPEFLDSAVPSNLDCPSEDNHRQTISLLCQGIENYKTNKVLIAAQKAKEEQERKRAELEEKRHEYAKTWTVESDFEISKNDKYGEYEKSHRLGLRSAHTFTTTEYKTKITSIFNFKANYVRTVTEHNDKLSTETQPFSHFDNNIEIQEAHEAFKVLNNTAPEYRRKPVGPNLTFTKKK